MVVKREARLSLEVLASAIGVAVLETQVFSSCVVAKKLHRTNSSRLNALRVCLAWVKCSGTHQDRNLAWWKKMVEPTVYLYGGDRPRLVEEVDSSGNVLTRYTQGLQIDEPLAELRSGTTSYFEADGLRSVTSLTGASGTVSETYGYDGFGKLITSTGTITNPFAYTGRESDSETNLYYYRARYYDANIGRFLSEDGIGNDEGTDLYPYVSNSPVNLTDPTGMYTLSGFPTGKESQMRDAIQNAIDTLKKDCSSCAGPNAPKIIHALETAKFVYKPDLDSCGYTPTASMIHLSKRIEIGDLAFDFGRCCSLASTVAHEASHLGAGTTDKDKPGSAYDIEKKCFNCGTGHPPPKPPKGK